MSVINRNSLKAEFQEGNMATEAYFHDFIDSTYNRAEDSVLMGPLGMTGKYGLLGPTGGTTIGMYIIDALTPSGPTASGSTGMVIIKHTGSTGAYMFVHTGTQWYRFEGARTF
jgi:hypothetical protein